MSSAQTRAVLRGSLEAAVLAASGAERIVRLCPRCGSASHGRPRLVIGAGRSAYLSMSYAEGMAAAVWSSQAAVGIDVELAGPPVPGVGDRLAWTRVEALLKTTGEGLTREPGDLDELAAGRWHEPLALGEGYVGHLAADAAARPELDWLTVTGQMAGQAGSAR